MTRSLMRSAKIALSVSLALGCLPLPAEKAKIDVIMRAGPAEVVTVDGYVVHFDRRLIVLGATVSKTNGEGSNFAPQLRDLDAPPLPLSPLRPLGERFVGVSTQNNTAGTPHGPTVTADDIAELGVGAGGYPSDSLLFRGTISRGEEVWRFDWHDDFYVVRVCGALTDGRLTPLAFEAESQHALEIVVHVERLFVDREGRGELRAQPFVDADANDDHEVSIAEVYFARKAPGGVANIGAKIFDVALDGIPLECTPPNDAYGPSQRTF